MAYTNSPLVSYTKLSPNHSGQRTHSIDRITPHCVVGQCSVESLGNVFADPSRQASSNYGIGVDGRVGMYVEEKNRSWCSSSNSNDQRAVTVECASDNIAPYSFKDVVYAKLVDLCVDICQRNGKNKILWFNDMNTDLNYEPKSNEMVLTVHRWTGLPKYPTECPGDWMFARMQDLADKVNAKLNTSPSPQPQPTPSTFPPCEKTTTEQNEKPIWDYLMSKLNNAYGVSGMMGNLFAESGLRPENLQNTFEKKFGLSDTQYTDKVNNNINYDFVHDHSGYGLAQWTYWSRKDGLQKLCKQRNKPIQDRVTQLDWLWQELNTSYKGTLNILKNATSVKQASDEVLLHFEHPGAVDDPDRVEGVKAERLNYSMIFYNKYAGSTPTPTPTPTPVPSGKYVYQGVDYSPVFDPVYYNNKYNDLQKAFNGDADKLFNHFTTYGMKEARQACATFNPVVYRSKYSDLQQAYGNNWPEYYKHYCVYGVKEGRKGI